MKQNDVAKSIRMFQQSDDVVFLSRNVWRRGRVVRTRPDGRIVLSTNVAPWHASSYKVLHTDNVRKINTPALSLNPGTRVDVFSLFEWRQGVIVGELDGDDRVKVRILMGASGDVWSRNMDELAPIGWFTDCKEVPLYQRKKRLVKTDGSELEEYKS
jgi:hypothetical protein